MVRPPRPNRGGAFEKWATRLLLPALALALVAVVLGVMGTRGPDWRGWFQGPERGEWRAVTINGLDVADERMNINVADGEIRGGRDGCNYWGYSGEVDPQIGERMMTTTLAACMDTPELRAYDAIGHYRSSLRLISDDLLEVSYRGTTGLFRRWAEELDETERAADERAMEAARAVEPDVASPVYPRPSMQPSPPSTLPPHLSRIFDLFEQVDEGSTRRFGGSGLGLAIVAELIRLMDGTISVQSKLGSGSCFTVSLRLPEALKAPAQAVAAMQSTVASPKAAIGYR